MSFQDRRSSLPSPSLQTHLLGAKLQSSRRSFPQLPRPKVHHRPKKSPCYDWMFSSATNIHIAIDKSWFKTFTPFDTHVLTVAGQKPISVRGIGAVDLKIRCKPNSHQSRVITLEDVLYVPGWICNVFSDIYFDPSPDYVFDHKWTQNGVCFTKKQNGKSKAWGYTESFCGLDRLVLSRKPRGRSPMLEDKDREVWSVTLNWPQSQRDKWEAFRAKEVYALSKEHKAEILAQQQKAGKESVTESTELLLSTNINAHTTNLKLKSTSPTPFASKVSVRSLSGNHMTHTMAKSVSVASLDLEPAGTRMGLGDISTNKSISFKHDPDSPVSSLKASFNANRGLLKEFVAARSDDRKRCLTHEPRPSIKGLVKQVEAATKSWGS